MQTHSNFYKNPESGRMQKKSGIVVILGQIAGSFIINTESDQCWIYEEYSCCSATNRRLLNCYAQEGEIPCRL